MTRQYSRSEEWVEVVGGVPPRASSGRPRITLNPGEMRMRAVGETTSGGTYKRQFARDGRTDYHAAIRTVDGVRYLYIWRDAIT